MAKITIEDGGVRLDAFLADHYKDLHTRSQITKAIKSGKITLNDGKIKCGTILKTGDIIEVDEDAIEGGEVTAMPEDIGIEKYIVFEDDYLIILNKPRGITVHPGAGVKRGTLLNGLLFKFADSVLERAGIVHRLDKNTAGLMIVAKTRKTQEKLCHMFEKHEINRTYLGLVEGHTPQNGRIEKNIIRHPNRRTIYTTADVGGRHAITNFETVGYYKEKGGRNVSLVRFMLETGRTHQIRVHAKSIAHPLVGDPEYNPDSSIKYNGQLLESVEISFTHPITGQEIIQNIPLSADFQGVLDILVPI